MAALQTMRGMALVNAATLIAELGDLSRFGNPRQLMCNSSNLIRQSLLVSETGPGAGRGSHPRWDRDPPSGETEISE